MLQGNERLCQSLQWKQDVWEHFHQCPAETKHTVIQLMTIKMVETSYCIMTTFSHKTKSPYLGQIMWYELIQKRLIAKKKSTSL